MLNKHLLTKVLLSWVVVCKLYVIMSSNFACQSVRTINQTV